MELTCSSCGSSFKAKRSTARYCSVTCRSRANRDRKAAAESVQADADAGKPEHELVRAVRAELTKAGAIDTFAGQLALQLARKVATPDETGVTALSKELRTVMAAAVESKIPPPGEPPAEPDDEIDLARRRREQKLRKAAGRS